MKCRKNMRKMLAGILTAGMLLSSAPSVAYAVEGENGAVFSGQEEAAEEIGAETGQEAEQTEQEENAGMEDALDAEGDVSGTQEDGTTAEKPAKDEEAPAPGLSENTPEEPESGESVSENTAEKLPENVMDAAALELNADGNIAGGKYDNITWVIDGNGKLTVTGSGDYNRVSNTPPWYHYAESIKSAEVRVTGMTYAGYMFSGCRNLVSLDVSGFDTRSVTNMELMFSGCSSLTSLDVSGFDTRNVKYMGMMFAHCSSLTSLDVSGFDTRNVSNMGAMFSHCSGLTSLDVSGFDTRNVSSGSGLYAIVGDMQRMFSGCSSLTSLDVGGFDTRNVTDMGEMFQNCSSLVDIDISSFDTRNVKDMRWMFSGCSGLASLDLSNFDMRNLVQDDPNNSSYKQGMDVMFSGCSGLRAVELPDTMYSIGRGEFKNCTALSSIEIPDGVTDIGEDAFAQCANLENIVLPGRMESIGRNVFSGCGKLESILLPDSLTVIGDSAFWGCGKLGSIEIPDSVTYIGRGAFSGTGISSIRIPDGITGINYRAFSGCEKLISVELPKSLMEIDDYAFSDCGFAHIDIPKGVARIGQQAFARDVVNGSPYLRSIDLPISIKVIESGAFSGSGIGDVYYGGYESDWDAVDIAAGNEELAGATIHYFTPEPQTVEGVLRSGSGWKIGWKCTYRSSSDGVVRNAKMEISVSGTGAAEELYLYSDADGAFPWELAPYHIPISAVTSLVIRGNPGTTKKLRIPTNAFKGYSSLCAAVFEKVSSIDSGAFEDCAALSSVGFLDETSLAVIGSSAFKNCKKLKNVEFPSSLHAIGAEAFQNTALQEVTLGSNITEIGTAAFAGCSSLLIWCAEGSYVHQYAQENGLSFRILRNANTTMTRIQKKDIPFHGWYASKTLKMDWGWDLLLGASAGNYDHRLAKIALSLSAAAEKSESAVKGLMGELGTTSNLSSYGTPQMTVGYQTLTMPDGDKKYVFIAVLRGTDTDSVADVNNDVLSSLGVYDWGASAVYNGLKKYIGDRAAENNVTIDRNNIKILITGHSLGGAAANIVAEKLNNDYGASNVFAYTFAAPSPLKSAAASGSRNIHNIICCQDSVPLHFSTRKKWYGYGRGGSFSIHSSRETYQTYSRLTGKDLDATYQQEKMVRLHAPDVYMSYLLTRLSPYTPFYAGSASILCPVDLKIYNSAGELVCSVTDNHVDEENMTSGVLATVGGENNDEKYFYLLKDDTYKIELTGTDTGTMKYTAQYVNMSTGRAIDEKAFENVVLEKDKKMASSVSAWDKADTTINTDDKIDTSEVQLFVLGNNGEPEKEVLPDGNGTEIPCTSPDEVLPGDIPADGKIPEGLWIAGVKASYTYTGTAIKPDIRVYDGKKRLQLGQDYTASYKNNTKVNDAAKISTAPTIIVKGKGNYAGSETVTFQITAVDLSDFVVSAEDITVAYNKKAQKKVPVVTYNGKRLAANRDFTVSYPNGGDGAYKEAGTYDILLTAKNGGNFSGTRTVKCTITENTLLSKVRVKKIPTQVYTGEAIEPELTVTYKGTPLVKDTDYSVSYTDHTEIGTAKAILTGIGKYVGTKHVSFSITGTSLKGASVSGIENKIYNGNDQEQRFTVTLKGKTLTEGTDYDVLYEKNKNVGKASVTIKGKGAYTGTVKKTFTVGKFNIAANADGRFEVKLEQNTVPYAKGGAKPDVTVRFKTGNGKWETLKEGQDYTLSYRNHTTVNDGNNQNKQPVVTVKGKGSFSGTYGTVLTYKIVAQDIGQLKLMAQDKTYQNKKNIYPTKITITDLDGKDLKMGTDYNKVLTYSYANETTVNTAGNGMVVRAAGAFVDKNDVIPAGTILKVQAMAKSGGNYTGTLTGEYRIVQASISSASVSVPKQIYTGRAVTLEKKQITVRIKGKQLDESQYEIVPDSYKNNVKKGNAAVTIQGLDNYGGTRDVRFTIKAKGFLWWWRQTE